MGNTQIWNKDWKQVWLTCHHSPKSTGGFCDSCFHNSDSTEGTHSSQGISKDLSELYQDTLDILCPQANRQKRLTLTVIYLHQQKEGGLHIYSGIMEDWISSRDHPLERLPVLLQPPITDMDMCSNPPNKRGIFIKASDLSGMTVSVIPSDKSPRTFQYYSLRWEILERIWRKEMLSSSCGPKSTLVTRAVFHPITSFLWASLRKKGSPTRRKSYSWMLRGKFL